MRGPVNMVGSFHLERNGGNIMTDENRTTMRVILCRPGDTSGQQERSLRMYCQHHLRQHTAKPAQGRRYYTLRQEQRRLSYLYLRGRQDQAGRLWQLLPANQFCGKQAKYQGQDPDQSLPCKRLTTNDNPGCQFSIQGAFLICTLLRVNDYPIAKKPSK